MTPDMVMLSVLVLFWVMVWLVAECLKRTRIPARKKVAASIAEGAKGFQVPVRAPETPEQHELRSMARDWQRQFHTLEARVTELGYEVYYDDEGKPAVKGKDKE